MIRGRVFWGLFVLLIGVLLLLDNLGYLPSVNIWGLIWPLFLIAAGGWILWNYFHQGQEAGGASHHPAGRSAACQHPLPAWGGADRDQSRDRGGVTCSKAILVGGWM